MPEPAMREPIASPPADEDRRPLAYYEAIPYLLVLESIERDGAWLRRAEHPELPECVAEAASALEALDRLERERRRVLQQLWDRGAPIPVPRPPLRAPSAA
jgi:predicted RNase H-like HicB family nuclease